ncbi:MAG: translocation/assembly module TamB domain-containing protein [Xenococcaceae cyanobacterium]
MTSPSPNTPPNPPNNRRNLIIRCLQRARSPYTIVVGVTLVAIGVVGYTGVRILIAQKLPPLIETELRKILKREVRIGKLQSFSLTGIELGPSSIRASPTNPDNASIETIKVGFNVLPVLFRRPLLLKITLVEPDIYIEQDEYGKWVNLDDIELPPPPVPIDVTLRIKKGEIALISHSRTTPLNVQLDSSVKLFDDETQPLKYDATAAITDGKVKIQGETLLKTGQSQVRARVQNLPLVYLAPLIPNSPVELNSGELNANLNIELPSFKEINSTSVQGTVSLEEIEAEAKQLSQPVKASAKVLFQGQKLLIKEAKGSLGKIVALVSGEVDWEKGFDLDVNITPFSLANLLETVPVSLPVEVDGQMQVKLKLVGPVSEPVLTGAASSTRKMRIDKLEFDEISTNFQADLSKFVLMSFQMTPVAGGQITGRGIVETGLRKSLEEKKSIDLMAMPLEFNFKAELPTEAIASPYYRFPSQINIGTITAQAQVRGTPANSQTSLKWQAPAASASSVGDISGAGEVLLVGKNLVLRNTELQTGTGKVTINGSGNLESKKWQTFLTAESVSLDPFLSQIQLPPTASINLDNGNVRLSGRLDSFDPATIDGVANLALNVDGGNVALSSQLNSGTLEIRATADQIPLAKFISTSVPVALVGSQVNVSASLEQLLSLGSTPDLSSFNATADVQLAVADGTVDATAQLNSGVLEIQATADQISLAELVPDLPVPVALVGSQVNLSGSLEQILLSLGSTPDWSSFKATTDVQLAVADGTVNATGQLNNGQWQTDITASEIDLSLLILKSEMNLLVGSETPATGQQTYKTFQNSLNAQLNLSGDLDFLLKPNTPVAIQANAISVQMGEQSLNASGNILLSNLTTAPDISRLELDIEANSDLNTLLLTQLINLDTLEGQFLPERIDVTGEVDFKGRLEGKNLLSAPLAALNLELTGDLQLLDFSLNNMVFEPILAGPVKVAPGQEVAIDLRGKGDAIAAVLEPCNREQCYLPYLPASFEFRQGEGSEKPVIAMGKRQGERLAAEVQNFPLAVFNIAPGTAIGIPGSVTGEVTGAIDVNLFTLAATGNVEIKQPGVGYIKAEEFAASFFYDNNNGMAQLTSAYLQLGQSQYEFEGGLNIKSGEVNGKVNIAKGYVQDILTIFPSFRIEDIARLFQRPDYATAAEVQPKPVGDSDAALGQQVNLLWEIDQQIRAIAAKMKAGGLPTQIDIRGAYTADITLAGTLKEPQVNFKLQGSNWEWRPQPAFPALVEPLGLVMEEIQVIPVNQVLVQGNLEGGAIEMEPVRIELGKTVLSFAGNLSKEQDSASFEVENLSLDLVRNFVSIPFDMAGEINLKGSLDGSLSNPQVQGEIAFVDGAVFGRVLDETIVGNFSYSDARFKFRTTEPESIQVQASVPYPIQPEVNDRLEVDVKLGTEAIALVGLFTQGQVEWVDGEGEVTLNASGRLDFVPSQSLGKRMKLDDLAVRGEVTLSDATLKSAAFPDELNVTGKIALNNKRLKVEKLEGSFVEGTEDSRRYILDIEQDNNGNATPARLSVTGVLPLWRPLSKDDPDSSNPLTVAIEQGEIDLEELYQGQIDGKVVVTGAAILPVIGGKIRLQKGRVFVPKQDSGAQKASPAFERWVGAGVGKTDVPIVPRLKDFQVVLEQLEVKQSPWYKFRLGGDLTLNGVLDNLENLQPKGTIWLQHGEVDLVTTQFFVARRYENRIDFVPEQGLLNPNLNIQLKTFLFNVSLKSIDANEIPDDIVKSGRAKSIEITVTIEGRVNQLLPSLGKKASDVCQIRPDDISPIPENASVSLEELQQLTSCVQISAFENESELQLLFTPIVTLESSPPLSHNEIIALFGKQLGSQFASLAEELQQRNEAQLLEFGFTQLLLGPLLRGVLFEVNEAGNSMAQKIGLKNFRFFPVVETVYEVDNKSFVSISYDYNFNEFSVRYQMRF